MKYTFMTCVIISLIMITQSVKALPIDDLAACLHVDKSIIIPPLLDLYNQAIVEMPTPIPSIGWMLPGRANDLGWSYNSVIGAQALQRCFGVEWFIEDHVSAEMSVKAMQNLIAKGVKLVMATSFEFIAFVPEVAIANPSVMFVIPIPIEAFFAIPNIRSFSMGVFEGSYFMGYLAQAQSTKTHIGYVGAVDFFTEYQNANGFFFGMDDAAKDFNQPRKTMVMWRTGSYTDEDLVTFAARDIVSRFDADTVGQTPDPYFSQQWLRDNGYFGTGATGDMGQFLGSSVYGSILVRWDIPAIYAYSTMIVNGGTWGNTPPVWSHSTWLGSIGYGTLSPLVRPEVVSKVESIRTTMQSSPFASEFIWCGDRSIPLTPFGDVFDNSTNCLSFPQTLNMWSLHPDIVDQGFYEIALEVIVFPESSVIAMGVLMGLLILVSILTLCVIAIYRETAIIRFSSDNLSFVIMLCIIISEIGLVLYIPEPTNALCKTAVPLYIWGVFAALSVFASRTYGYFQLMKSSLKMKQNTFTVGKVLMLVPLTYIIPFVLGWLWIFVDNQGADTLTWLESNELEKYQVREVCSFSTSTEVIGWILVGYGLFIAGVVLFVSYMLSDIAKNIWKQEARIALMIMGAIVICCVIGITVVITIKDSYDGLKWIIFLCAFFIDLSIVGYYWPKVWMLLFDKENEMCAPFAVYHRRSALSKTNMSSANSSSSTVEL